MSLNNAQRLRLRRLTKASLLGVVGLEVIVLILVTTPSSRALLPVIDAGLIAVTTTVSTLLGTTNSSLATANGHLAQIETDTDGIRQHADDNAAQLGDSWDANLAVVTADPMDLLEGVSIADANPGAAMAAVVPGATEWINYHDEYQASADTVLTTLRTSLNVLNAQNTQIEDAAALDRISGLADGATSRLAMGALKVQSNLEVARQLHALRSQHALETSLYAVTESHRIGSDARTMAEDSKTNCRTAAALFSGPLSGPASLLLCP